MSFKSFLKITGTKIILNNSLSGIFENPLIRCSLSFYVNELADENRKKKNAYN